MKEEIILAGFGGQGVMLAGMLLTYAGMLDNMEVSWLPSYGPEMRGGTANCHVIISDKPISSPVIIFANSVIVMNKPSLDKYESQVVPGGILLVNSSLIEKKVERNDIRILYIPAIEIAKELGNSKTANMVMLGAFLRVKNILSRQTFLKALEAVVGTKNSKLVPMNMLAFEKGEEYVADYNKS